MKGRQLNMRHTRVLTITWPSDKPVKVHDITKALRKLPADAEATSIEPTTVEYVDAHHVGLRIEYTIDTDAERRRIIDEYRSLDPMRAFADIARASHNLPTRD